jgi:hypothetical protein
MNGMAKWRALLLCVWCVILLAVGVGCGTSDPPYPVQGKVLFKGKPAEGAVVTFVRQSGKDERYAAVVAEDGTFRLSARGTFDGAPAGHYAVTVFYLSPEKKVDGQNAGPDLLKGKYAGPRTTPLKVEIKPGENQLEPFVLN